MSQSEDLPSNPSVDLLTLVDADVVMVQSLLTSMFNSLPWKLSAG
jgi:hypothetical protein